MFSDPVHHAVSVMSWSLFCALLVSFIYRCLSTSLSICNLPNQIQQFLVVMSMSAFIVDATIVFVFNMHSV